MANIDITKYQNKVLELQRQADMLADAMQTNPDDDAFAVKLATVKIKLDAARAALEGAQNKKRREAERLNSPTYKAEIKQMQAARDNADKSMKQIFADAQKLQTKIDEWQSVIDDYNRLAKTHNQKNIGGHKYRLFIRLGNELKQWFKDWQTVENLSKPTPPPAERKLTQLQRDVIAMRYRNPMEPETSVRLLENDDGTGKAKYKTTR